MQHICLNAPCFKLRLVSGTDLPERNHEGNRHIQQQRRSQKHLGTEAGVPTLPIWRGGDADHLGRARVLLSIFWASNLQQICFFSSNFVLCWQNYGEKKLWVHSNITNMARGVKSLFLCVFKERNKRPLLRKTKIKGQTGSKLLVMLPLSRSVTMATMNSLKLWLQWITPAAAAGLTAPQLLNVCQRVSFPLVSSEISSEHNFLFSFFPFFFFLSHAFRFL